MIGMIAYAQNKGVYHLSRRYLNNFPVFIDSVKFDSEFISMDTLMLIYNELKKDSASKVYLYNFNIDKNGKVIPRSYDDDSLFAPINFYIKNVFNTYQWKYNRYKSRKKPILFSFDIIFDTVSNTINMYIDGIYQRKRNKIFSRKLLN
jgi:hypothetical protein